MDTTSDETPTPQEPAAAEGAGHPTANGPGDPGDPGASKESDLDPDGADADLAPTGPGEGDLDPDDDAIDSDGAEGM